jgi:hypothetical protein
MYYDCKDKSLSETSGFQEKIIADGKPMFIKTGSITNLL